MKNKIIIILVILIILIGGGLGIFFWQNKAAPAPPEISPPPSAPSAEQKIASWEDLEKVEIPSAYQIPGIKYDNLGYDCCLCAGIGAQYEHLGKGSPENLISDMAPPAMNRNMEAMLEALNQYGIGEMMYVGYYDQGKNTETRPEMQNFFRKYLTSPEKQTKLFKNEEEALTTLQKLIALDIPVIIAWEENLDLQPIPQNEIEDNTFNLIIGYDQQKFTYYTLPKVKNTVSVSEFKEVWKLQDTVFQYPVIPGNYTMIFLLP